jgi:dimeric dUTPase (all-alpha-NTP-PPase superfamily)
MPVSNGDAMKRKILSMLELQDAMNRKVAPDWRDRGFAWYRAIWTECAEMLDHYGWKWWKHQEPDMEQVRLEIVDIWHFALSIHLIAGDDPARTAERIAADLDRPAQIRDFRAAIEQMAEEAIRTRGADVSTFAALMRLAGMDFDDLYKTYVGKNVLNRFRQDYGYKDGTYLKTWDGREDNEHLARILATVDADSPAFGDQVYERLARAYPG